MGSELCSTLPNKELELTGSNLIVKYPANEMKVTKNKDQRILLSGNSQLYSVGPQKKLIYDGQMRNSKFDGFGKLYNNDKLIYEGQFKNGLFQGWGVTEKYTGQFREGKYDGFGIYKEFLDESKDIVTFYYEGYFSEGRYSGNGLQIKDCRIPASKIEQIHDTEGITDYVLESIQNGNSIAKKYEAKQVYIGQFAYGYRNGVGRLFKDNRQYNGTFLAGNTSVKGTAIDLADQNERKRKQKWKKIHKKKFIIC